MADIKNTDIEELSERVLKGIKKALQKLIETSAINNEDLVVGDKDGNVRMVSARDLLQKLQK